MKNQDAVTLPTTLTLCVVRSPSGQPMAMQAFITMEAARNYGANMQAHCRLKGELQPTFTTHEYASPEVMKEIENVVSDIRQRVKQALGKPIPEVLGAGEQGDGLA